MEQTIQAIDHAARQSDRWLFIGTLFLLGVFALFVARYFLKQYNRLVDDHAKARETYQVSLRSIVQDQHSLTEKLAVTLDRNSCVLQEVERELGHCRRERDRRRHD